MGSAHLLLTARVEDLVAVDDAGPGNGHVLEIDTENQLAVPFAESCLGRVGRGREVLVVIQPGSADQSSAGLEKEGHIVLKVNGAGDISAGAEAHLSATGFSAGLDGLVNGNGINFLSVTCGAIVAYAEHTIGGDTDVIKGCKQSTDNGYDKNNPG